MYISSDPGAPDLTLTSVSGDSVTVSWTIPSETVVERYDLMWSIEGPQQPILIRDTVSGSTQRFTVPGLDEYENATITITVTSVNAAGSNSSLPLTLHFRGSKTTNSSNGITTIEAFIGGVVGSFVIGLTIGTVAAFIIFKFTLSCRKRISK